MGTDATETDDGLSQGIVRTYLYMRVAVAAMVLLLFVGLGVQIVHDGGDLRSLMSAYFYSPVQSIFVATLVAAGILAIAIRGRPGPENALLDIAGLLLPIVAAIPTPLKGDEGAACPRREACVPAKYLDLVDVTVTSLAIVGLLGLVFAVFTLRARRWGDRFDRWGLAAAAALWVVFVPGFWGWWGEGVRGWILDLGHYAAAISAIAAMIAVAFLNARASGHTFSVARRPLRAAPVYRAIAWALAVVLALGAVIGVVELRRGSADTTPLVFWIEAAVLGLFAIFWTVQTLEYRQSGLPAEAR
ncbi:hypothetical protein [Demequina maris]|uniref:hypothetical protein n=1 Tax=Demequina maris TaxID=1638982 RepID=UPI00078286A2|nr:hypothetical protein [Demequina maris]